MSNSSWRSFVPGSNFGQFPVPVLKLFFQILELAIPVDQPKLEPAKLVTTSVEWLFDIINNPDPCFLKKSLIKGPLIWIVLIFLELQSCKV